MARLGQDGRGRDWNGMGSSRARTMTTIVIWTIVIAPALLLVAYHIRDARLQRAIKREIDAVIAESQRDSEENERKLRECRAFTEAVEWRTTFGGKRGQS